ncbi:hypothetical protein M3J09_002462 [Ascochyta lentis]
MSAIIECAFVNSIITIDCDRDRSSRATSTARTEPCAQQDTMGKRISELKTMWLRPSAARDKSESHRRT